MKNIKIEELISAAEIDLEATDKETIVQLQNNLNDAYKNIRDLGEVIRSQETLIQNMKQRFKDHGIHILEKSIVETTREELEKINKSIPAIRTRKAGKRQLGPSFEEQLKFHKRNTENVISNMIENITTGIDLEKYGIDPKTLLFKPGWGPNGKLPEPDINPALKPNLLQKVKNFFKGFLS